MQLEPNALCIMSYSITLAEAIGISLESWCEERGWRSVVEDAASCKFVVDELNVGAIVFHVGALQHDEYEKAPAILSMKERFPSAKVLIVADTPTMEACVADLAAGAWAYASTCDGLRQLAQALDFVLDGERYATVAILSGVTPEPLGEPAATDGVRRAPPLAGVPALTERQRNVARQLAYGHSNKVIARALGISEATVKVHMRSVMQAVGARNRTEAALILRNVLSDGEPSDRPTVRPVETNIIPMGLVMDNRAMGGPRLHGEGRTGSA